MNAIRPSKLETSNIRLTKIGLEINGETTKEEFETFGKNLSAVQGCLGFAIGDYINHGTKAYGDTYTEAIEFSGLEYETLRKYCSVARAIPIERRRENLSYTIHSIVAPLPAEEQEHWLDIAVSNNLGKRLLAASIKHGELLSEIPVNKKSELTHLPLINRLTAWWRDKQDIALKASPEQRQQIARDLEPAVRIYVKLGGDMSRVIDIREIERGNKGGSKESLWIKMD